MATDEQILAKTTELLANLQEKCWPGYEKKGMKTMFGKRYPNCVKKSKKKKRKNEEIELYEEKVLREVTEDEMRVLEDVLDDLDTANLPLNDLFSGKMRVVIPFPTTDPSTDLGKFAKFFETQEYDVQWDKGIVSATREVSSISDLVAYLGGDPQKKKFKKFQMKIGKLFAKMADLSRKKKEIVKSDPEFQKNEDYKRISKQILLYTPNPGIAGPAGYDLEDLATKYGEYWQQNAAYIKNNINEIDSDKFSIIITRHPIDVLRMSDFDTITSCHSPASRTNAYQSYYKCAVAEAQGHGAVAYVVETEELLSATNTGNIDSAEQEIQEGEIFADDKRPFTGDIKPLSRLRLRHVRYYDTDEPKRYDDGQDVGMPEKRVYGADIPGIADTVTDWARASQEDVIQNMPREDGKVNLSRFTLFGGSYEDTAGTAGRAKLMQMFLGTDEVTGNMQQNTDTEDSLDANLVGDIIAQYEGECEQIMNDFNDRMAQTYTDYEVGDDGGEGAFIRPFAAFIAKWPVDEWKRLPGNQEEVVWNSVDELNDIFGDIFYPSDIDTPTIRRIREEIHLTIKVNFEHPSIYGNLYMALPDEYQEALQKVDSVIDDRRDTFEEVLTTYFKREGQMEGGAYIQLATAIEDDMVSSYEWDVETDGEYYDSYETTASHSFYYDPEEFGLDIRVLAQILDSRDFRIELRRQLLEEPRKAQNTRYYLQMNATTVEVGGEIKFTSIFSINADEPDIMAGLFQELIEGDMDDEDNLNVVYRRVLAQVVKSRQPASTQTNESVVKDWKEYLKI
jgi:hypothetical protein